MNTSEQSWRLSLLSHVCYNSMTPVNLLRSCQTSQLTYSQCTWVGLEPLSRKPVLRANSLPVVNNGYFTINLHEIYVTKLEFKLKTMGYAFTHTAKCAICPVRKFSANDMIWNCKLSQSYPRYPYYLHRFDVQQALLFYAKEIKRCKTIC